MSQDANQAELHRQSLLKKLKDLVAEGLTFSECKSVFGKDDSNPFVAAARKYTDEGTLEFDDRTVVSQSESGAHVMAWRWVDNSEAGVTPRYRVMLHEEAGDKFQIVFDCFADDEDHAEEQALNAYPAGRIISITFLEDDAMTPNEIAVCNALFSKYPVTRRFDAIVRALSMSPYKNSMASSTAHPSLAGIDQHVHIRDNMADDVIAEEMMRGLELLNKGEPWDLPGELQAQSNSVSNDQRG